MQTANILLALAGDTGNTVFKTGVTPSEVAILQLIHGSEAVTDIEPTGEVSRSDRAELLELNRLYGRATINGDANTSAVRHLFPGAAARAFQTFAELELPEELYKAKTRVAPDARDPLDHDRDGRKGGSLPKEPKSYNSMKKQELLELAHSRGVEVAESDKKDDIVALLELADEKANAPVGDAEPDDGIGDMDDNNEKMFS